MDLKLDSIASNLSREEMIVLGLLVVAFIAYPIIVSVLSKLVQPTRLKMADLANEILSSDKLDNDQREMIQGRVNDAYSSRFMFAMVILMPPFVLGRIFNFIRAPKTPYDVDDLDLRGKILELEGLHTRATAAANPICAVILAIEVAILVAALVPLGMIRRAITLLMEGAQYTESKPFCGAHR